MKKEIPVCGSIPYTKSGFTVTFEAVKSSPGCFTTSSQTGYDTPEKAKERFPSIPFIRYDKSDLSNVINSIKGEKQNVLEIDGEGIPLCQWLDKLEKMGIVIER